MKLCFCRFLMAVAIMVLAIIWWPAVWAKWIIVVVAGILAVMSLFYKSCFCADRNKAKEE